MLPSKNRLRKGFLGIYKDKKKVVDPMFLLFYKENGKDYPRVGFVIRKKLGKAYLRNKVKRMFRSVIREQLTENKDFQNLGCDFIFLVNHNITNWETTRWEDIKNNIINAITKVDKT
ncbi:MAG: ribonuclease P protein component [Patescibacteria group bacterium]|jgi:ribonuclease P protein component